MPAAGLKIIGGIIIAVGAWAGIVAYVGPTFGYPMPPGSDQSAWEWSASHTWRHLLPGVAAVIAGGLLWARARAAHLAGAGLGFLAGAWMILSPFVVRAWLDGGGGGGGEASTTMQIITPLGYHHVPGIIVTGLSAFVLGSLLTARLGARREPAAAPRGHEGVTVEREREPAQT